MVPLVYSPQYNITAFGLQRLHPFDSVKYRRIINQLVREGLRRPTDFLAPELPDEKALLSVHTTEYLRSLRDRKVLARILELWPVALLPACLTRWRVLRPMRLATGGTLLACRRALERGLAINLGGGYHHAGPARGEGYCVYADVPWALHRLHAEGKVTTALVIDTDAHQGNGTADCVRSWDWAHILDFFDDSLFPIPKAAEDLAVPLGAGTGGKEYLSRLRYYVPEALDRFRPDLVVHNAGSDVLATDPLSRLRLAPEDLAERDLFVLGEARRRNVPAAMVLSGGYGPLSWEAHASSISNILRAFDDTI